MTLTHVVDNVFGFEQYVCAVVQASNFVRKSPRYPIFYNRTKKMDVFAGDQRSKYCRYNHALIIR